MRRGVWGPFIYLFIYLFLNLAEAAASAASMQFTALTELHEFIVIIGDLVYLICLFCCLLFFSLRATNTRFRAFDQRL